MQQTAFGRPLAGSSGPRFGALLPHGAQQATGVPFAGLPQVGALFPYDGNGTGAHFCSGSVVASSGGDIVATAAHCVYDTYAGAYVGGVEFVPGYHDGVQPYGVWQVARALVAPQWIDDADPDYDVAFLVVRQPGSGRRIQDVVGADELGVDASVGGMTQVVGYPLDAQRPVTCTAPVKLFSATQLEFDCGGFPEGTSGGPFLAGVDPATGRSTVVGVIGGYQLGGETPDISYSAYFGDTVAALFRQAEAVG
ncbi:trypsin-like serine protease [Actinocrinis puniceicyclus]|uniref:Trypsin-like serine protease n=1 Tax=Actinocrinis puniceicyclus TaxID=977794 RepID=A0A8J7WLN7_9ACTN|nr:trypsin-like serine protease [Actinocrinis puniceicyclus]MBS2964646.1 trypsin-like serine protease [Actinocrinis puniceicyclus]